MGAKRGGTKIRFSAFVGVDQTGAVTPRGVARALDCAVVRREAGGVWRLALRDADLADAAVLAVGAWDLQRRGRLLRPFAGFERLPERRREGWIMGLGI